MIWSVFDNGLDWRRGAVRVADFWTGWTPRIYWPQCYYYWYRLLNKDET